MYHRVPPWDADKCANESAGVGGRNPSGARATPQIRHLALPIAKPFKVFESAARRPGPPSGIVRRQSSFPATYRSLSERQASLARYGGTR